MKGVIALLVASVFLLVLVSSASRLAVRAPDYSYQPVAALSVQQEAVEAAFSDALSGAAAKALAVSRASGQEAPAAVKAALYLSALDFEAQLKENGYDIAFWCGKAGERARQQASEMMLAEKAAVLPEGTLALSSPACAAGFDVNLLSRKARAGDVGFSIYSPGPGIGHAVQLPDGYEVDIGG